MFFSRQRLHFLALVLFIIIGAFIRCVRIGELPAFTDEGALILSALDPLVGSFIRPEELGRPLIYLLFKPAQWLHTSLLSSLTLVEIARLLSSAAVLGSTLILTGVAWRWCGTGGAWIVAAVWTMSPFAFLHGRLALQDPFSALFLSVTVGAFVFRPPQLNQDRAGEEKWWIVVAGAGFLLAVLNKITSVMDLWWLFALFWFSQRERREPLWRGFLAKKTAVFVLALAALAFLGLAIRSTLRLQGQGFVGGAFTLSNLVERALNSQALYLELVREYMGESFPLFVLFLLFLCLFLRREVQVLALVLVVHTLVVSVVYSTLVPIFLARYIFQSLVPWSLLLAVILSELWRTKRALGKISATPWFVGLMIGWCIDIRAVLKNPIENTFSSSAVGTDRPTRDYEWYTAFLCAGKGLSVIRDFVHQIRADEPDTTVVLVGRPHLEAMTIGSRLIFHGESGVQVIDATPDRWDFAAVLFALQAGHRVWQLAETNLSAGKRRIFYLDTPFCQNALPLPCGVPLPEVAGVKFQLVQEFARAEPMKQMRILEVVSVDPSKFLGQTPPGNGRYRDGAFGPLASFALDPAMISKIEGEELPGLPVSSELIELQINGQSVPFSLSTARGRFVVTPHFLREEHGTLPAKELRVVFKQWVVEHDPDDHSSTFYNANRALSVKALRLVSVSNEAEAGAAVLNSERR